MTRASCLVLGIGNLLLSDEGVGIHVVRALEAAGLPPGVDVLDGGTGGFRLISCFQEYDHLVLVDACLDGQPVGTTAVIQPRFASDFPRALSAHDIGLRDLIESVALLGPLPNMFLVTISVAAEQPHGIELSGPVQAAVPRAAAQVRQLAASLASPPACSKK
jgi:hydrogenase maturation protease